jgi:peptide deformylase
MIIKKSELKILPANELNQGFASKFNFDEVDASMLTNIMFDRMSEMGGAALSAPQVGIDMCMFVMGVDHARVEVFNPTILSYSKEEALMNEGSLTFPGILVIVKRPIAVTVKYYNKNGELQQNEFQGLTARIFQHAFDHLQGTTMKDKVSKLKWDMATKRLNNYKQKLVKKYTQKKLLDIKKAMEEQTNGNT